MVRLFGRRRRTEDAMRRTRETWFGRIGRLFQAGDGDERAWDDLEEALISADVGVTATQAVILRTRERLQKQGASTNGNRVLEAIKGEMSALLDQREGAVSSMVEPGGQRPKPLVVLVVGVNGSGKTTSIAKLAHYFKEHGDRVILGAADTFRAAAIEQLQVWGKRLDAEVVAHQSGGDSAAVAFDAVQAAQARGADVVVIDTAGRLHTKSNLMEELKKVRRVVQRLDDSAPHLTLLVLDAMTGQNGLAQARAFVDAVACDGIFLAKLDGTARGGIAFAIEQELGLPVLFIGTGEGAEDMSPFDPDQFVEALFATSTTDARAERP
jgi:fused signal recognition particle receptor